MAFCKTTMAVCKTIALSLIGTFYIPPVAATGVLKRVNPGNSWVSPAQ